MSSNTYELMDEPNGRMAHLALPPLILLFATMFIPKPYQLLMPIVFLINAWLMGCYDFKKQVIITVVGSAIIAAIFFGAILLLMEGYIPVAPSTAGPYFTILLNAGLFTLLYKLQTMQNPTHGLIAYIRDQKAHSS